MQWQDFGEACHNRPPLKRLRNKEIVFQTKDWLGRDVFLDKQTYNNHIARLHLEAALAVDRIKTELSRPTYVVYCKAAKSENAILAVPVGDHPWVIVAITTKWITGTLSKMRVISTWYSIPNDELVLELDKGPIIWPNQPLPSTTIL
jgi:hypothetical protein